ncbi:MAG: alanine racemase [Planctomycetes bacterium]|nr:alanine racemase [Planctomycetota bacterium]
MRRRHRAWARIDLAAFRANLATAQKAAGRARVWPVLKANAYGHGARRLALACADEGVARIGVGDSGEALELREAGVRVPLLVLGTVIDAELPALLRHDIEVGVHSEGRARALGAFARTQSSRLGVHLKIDTGMTRLGVLPEAALRVAQAIADEPGLELRGVMTHFAARDGIHDPRTHEQQRCFQGCIRQLRDAGISIPAVHGANSAALFSGLQPLGDAVRPGIALLGILPAQLAPEIPLQPVLSLHAQIVFLKDIPADQPVGYGGDWISHRPTRLATLPIGYADGVPYRLGSSGRGTVLVRGQRCPVVGAISMDYCTIDVGHVRGVEVGDTVTLIGRDGAAMLNAQEVADAAGTIPYEITCSIGARVQRVYHDAAPHPAEERQSAPLPAP